MKRFAPFVLALLVLFIAESLSAQVFLRAGQPERPVAELRQPTHTLGPLAVDPSLADRLQHALDSVYAETSLAGRYGVTASVLISGIPQWLGTSGISRPGKPMEPHHLMEMASNTKTFVAAAILQLEEEGKLSIADSIGKYLPAFPYVDGSITIKQLLEHSSGLYDYMNDDPDGILFYDAYFTRPSYRWTPSELLDNHMDEPHFSSGKNYRYCNTGFLLLGMVIERVTDQPVAQLLRSRFFEPLGMTRTFAGSDEEIEGEFATNWVAAYNGQPEQDLSGIDKTAQLSLAWTAGYIVSTPEDLATWSHALYRGKLLSQVSMTKMLQMRTWSDGTRYGLGTGQVPYGSKRLYGHNGRLLGFQSMMYTNPRDSVTFVIAANSDPLPGDITLNDYAIAILGEIYRPASSVSLVSDTARIYQIEGGRTLKVELADNEIVHDATVYDMLGRSLSVRADLLGGNDRIDLDQLPKGVYTYRIRTDRSEYTGKLSR